MKLHSTEMCIFQLGHGLFLKNSLNSLNLVKAGSLRNLVSLLFCVQVTVSISAVEF